MKKMFSSAFGFPGLLVAILMFQTSSVHAQFGVAYSAENGPGFIVVSRNVTGADTFVEVTTMITASFNSSGSPVVASTTDSTSVTTGTITNSYTLPISTSYPRRYYVRVVVTGRDTYGNIHTASAVSYVVVVVTPPFLPPTDTLNPPIPSYEYAQFSATFDAGFDTGRIQIIISWDSTWSHPEYTFAIKDSTLPIIGTVNQKVYKTYNLYIGASSQNYSYRVIFHNSVGADTSAIFAGTTLTAPAPSTVTSPYNVSASATRIAFQGDVNTNGLATVCKAFRSATPAGSAIDSIVFSVPAGLGTVHLDTAFSGLAPLSGWYIWFTSKDSLNPIPYVSSRVFKQTMAMPDSFMIVFDSVKTISATQSRVYYHLFVPTGDSAHTLTVAYAGYPVAGSSISYGSVPTVYAGITNLSVILDGLVEGNQYVVSVYGPDDGFTHLYSLWDVQYVFTFNVPPPIITAFYADHDTTLSGATVALHIHTTGAVSDSLNGSDITGDTTVSVVVDTTTTFTLVAVGMTGATVTQSLVVIVKDTATLTAVVTPIIPATTVNPNPANDYIYITNDGLRDIVGKIFDMSGKQVLSFIANGKSKNEISLANLADGEYLLTMQGQSGTETKKIIVRH